MTTTLTSNLMAADPPNFYSTFKKQLFLLLLPRVWAEVDGGWKYAEGVMTYSENGAIIQWPELNKSLKKGTIWTYLVALNAQKTSGGLLPDLCWALRKVPLICGYKWSWNLRSDYSVSSKPTLLITTGFCLGQLLWSCRKSRWYVGVIYRDICVFISLMSANLRNSSCSRLCEKLSASCIHTCEGMSL